MKPKNTSLSGVIANVDAKAAKWSYTSRWHLGLELPCLLVPTFRICNYYIHLSWFCVCVSQIWSIYPEAPQTPLVCEFWREQVKWQMTAAAYQDSHKYHISTSMCYWLLLYVDLSKHLLIHQFLSFDSSSSQALWKEHELPSPIQSLSSQIPLFLLRCA